MTNSAVVPFQVSVSFEGTSPATTQPNTVRITQEEFCHDVAELEFWADDVTAYSSGQPVQIQFGRPGAFRVFYGYVNEATRINNHLSSAGTSLTSRNATRIWCVGSTYWMKDVASMSWTNSTVTQAISQIAQQFGLSLLSSPADATIWPVLQMASQSWWEFCVKNAKRIGFTLVSDGIQLVLIPRQTNPLQALQNIVAYDYSSSLGILSFTPTVGANATINGALRNRQAAAVNPFTNAVMTASIQGAQLPPSSVMGLSPDVPIFTDIEHLTACSMGELSSKLSGCGLDNQLYLGASALFSGNALILPSSLVFITNGNGSQNGVWYTHRAVHTLTPQTYTTETFLGRNSTGETQIIGPSLATGSVPTANLVQGRWRSG